MTLPPDVQKRVNEWLEGPYDEQTKQEVRSLTKNPKELIDAFYADLAFGTGGMRGLMGVGTSRLNIYTIQMATQGLANYLHKQKKRESLSVVIGFDSRHHSEEFAWQAARVLAGNKIRVFLLTDLRPTPFVSFACRQKQADAAIMITASHNPKEYNGYKVYWSDGAQVVHPHDSGIVQEANAIKNLNQIKMAQPNHPLIIPLSNELDSAYLSAIRPLQHFPEQNQKHGHLLHIIYTPLHGTGITLTPRALADWGFTCVECVKEQSTPDGNFPTTPFPNPEYAKALELGSALLQKNKADICIANDPDADRMGVVVLEGSEPFILNGNQIAALCTEFLCKTLLEQKKMPANGAFVTTIVSTPLIKQIAASYQQSCFEVLTGFKYIGEKIHEWESAKPSYHFLFGAEESYGYLIGTHARDKDAIVSSCLIAEIALHAKQQGKTLKDLLYSLYEKQGVFGEKQSSLTFEPNKEEMEKTAQLMQILRKEPPLEIAGSKVVIVEDYLKHTRYHTDSTKTERLTLPTSDVLVFHLADKSRLIIRPSGTEPKVKLYASTSLPPRKNVALAIAECEKRLDVLLDTLSELISK